MEGLESEVVWIPLGATEEKNLERFFQFMPLGLLVR